MVHLAALRLLRSVNESVHGNESAEFYCKLCPYKYDVKEVVSDRDLRRLAFFFSAVLTLAFSASRSWLRSLCRLVLTWPLPGRALVGLRQRQA